VLSFVACWWTNFGTFFCRILGFNQKMPMQSPNTLADFPPDRFSITGHCYACGRSVWLDTAQLPPDMPIPTLRASLRCTVCGSRDTGLTISYAAAMDTSGHS